MIFSGGGGDKRTFLIYDFLKNEASVITVLAMNQKKLMEISDSDDDCAITGGKFIVFLS